MAGLIPQSFINDLVERVDIVDVIDARITLKKAGKNYQALCPFHNEKTPSFSVSPDKQFYHCFGCGASGTSLTFLMEFERMEFVEAVETLARTAGVEVPREPGARPQQDHTSLYDVLGQAEKYFRRALKAAPDAVDYLKRRGLSGEVARDFGIGYAPDSWDGVKTALAGLTEPRLLEAGLLTRSDKGRVYDRFRGRVMFPIRDVRGRVIGFGGRVLGAQDGPKYLNSPETPVFHKGRELYGLYEARRALRRLDRLVVVEGYMDVVALVQAGIANAVATLGTSATVEHFHKLYRYTEEVVCCFDGDNAGRQAAWRALESALPALTEGRQLKFMFLPEGEDPDSLVRARGKDGFLTLAAGAQTAIEYLIGHLSEGLDLKNLDHQARLISLAEPHLQRAPDGALKQLMVNRLHQLTGITPNLTRRSEPARASAGPRAGAAGPRDAARISQLERRLLRYLVRRPALLQAVPPASRSALRELGSNDLFLEVVGYLEETPEADTAELLGRWSGTAQHQTLMALLVDPISLTDAELQGEFTDGVARFLDLRQRDERRRLLADLRENPTRERFAQWMAASRGQAQGPGN